MSSGFLLSIINIKINKTVYGMEDTNVAAYSELSKEGLLALKDELESQFAEAKGKGLKLDMSRGKPSTEQLNLSMEMMDVLKSDSDLVCEEGVDCRNYGVLDGIKEAKQLLATNGIFPTFTKRGQIGKKR